MCGIFGRVGPGDPAALRMVALLSQSRGIDAAGIAWRASNGRFYWRKHPGAMRKLLRRVPNRILESDVVIGHTRLATSGPPSNNVNNHPHVGRRWLIVHNGIISNAAKFPLTGGCDSEAILRALERTPKTGFKAITKASKALTGLMAVASVDLSTGDVYLWVDDYMGLWVCNVGGAMAFASEKNFLKLAYPNVKVFVLLPACTVVRLRPDGIDQRRSLPKLQRFQSWYEDKGCWAGYPATYEKGQNGFTRRIPRPTPIYKDIDTDAVAQGWQKVAVADEAGENLTLVYGSPIAYRLTCGGAVLCLECAIEAGGQWSDGLVALYRDLDITKGKLCDSCRMPLYEDIPEGP